MRRHVLLILATLHSVAWAQSPFTDARAHRPGDAFAVTACGDAAARDVRSRNPMAGNVHVTEANSSPTAQTRTDVSGKGTLSDSTGTVRNFTFRCTYEIRTGAASSVMVFL